METILRAALLAWLRSGPAPLDRLNAVEEEAPLRASPPWLGIVASASADWSTKTQAGREVRVAIELQSRGDDPAADAALVRAVEDRVEALPRAQQGFALATVQFLRSRAERRPNNRRAVLLEYRFRCLAA
jgi:hypothetical protein